jgi:hypothetical protein
LTLAGAAAALYFTPAWGAIDWRGLVVLQRPAARPAAPAAARPSAPALPRRGEVALARSRALVATGHLRDALTALDLVRPTDPQKADADRLRGEIQMQLIALTSLPAQPPAEPSAPTPARSAP